jgi:hypothetical protein
VFVRIEAKAAICQEPGLLRGVGGELRDLEKVNASTFKSPEDWKWRCTASGNVRQVNIVSATGRRKELIRFLDEAVCRSVRRPSHME